MSQFRWNFASEVYFKQLNVETPLAVQNYPLSTAYIDVSAFERFGFLISVGATDSALSFQVKQDTSATETASIKNVTGALVSPTAADDNTDFLIEVDTSVLDSANGFKFVTLAAAGGTGNDYGSIIFFGWAARTKPVTQQTSFVSATHLASVVV